MFNHPSIEKSPIACFVLLGAVLALGASACASLRPVDSATRVGDKPATAVVVSLTESCWMAPGGAPMGRPNGIHGHTLPAGKYTPGFADEHGVYFASPTGIAVTEPAPVGTRPRPGGIYVPSDEAHTAYEYLGDQDRVTTRQPLPERCRYTVDPVEATAQPG